MIAITGAGGHLGSSVVRNLLRFVPPGDIIATGRRPDELTEWRSQGVQVRYADFADPDSLEAAFRDADRLLLISASGIDFQSRSEFHRNAVDAAVRAQVGRVFYTSLTPGHDSVAYVMKAHLATEAYLRSASIDATIVKNGVYAEAWPTYLGDLNRGEVLLPDDGPINWTSRADLAEGLARLLTTESFAMERVYLTGEQTLDMESAARQVAAVLQRNITVRRVSREEYVASVVAAGKSPEYAQQWLTTYDAAARGEFARTDPLLGDLLGRACTSFDAAVADAG